MTPIQLEHYCFYRLYSIDLNTVTHSLSVLRRYRRPDVRYPLIRDIIVGYARPFSLNRGTLHSRHALRPKRMVPRPYRPLHDELIALRQELFAHTDLSRYNPQVAKWALSGRTVFPMGFSALDYPALDRKVPDITRLVSAVEAAINAEIAALERAM